MDKMREEFESAWAESRCDDDGVIGNKPTRSTVNADCYSGGAAQFAWVWWQMSRASLCVELPKITDFAKDSRGAREVLNFEFAVECVARELNDVGVRHE